MSFENKLAKRGLYIYGVIDNSKGNTKTFVKNSKEFSGYRLPRPVKETLLFVLESLVNSRLELIEPDCIKKQKDYFNLESDVGWVLADKEKRLFWVDGCGQPPK